MSGNCKLDYESGSLHKEARGSADWSSGVTAVILGCSEIRQSIRFSTESGESDEWLRIPGRR